MTALRDTAPHATIHEAGAALERGDVVTAEHVLAHLGSDLDQPRQAAAAITTLAFSLLLPQKRYGEARPWLDVAMGLEVGFESWNARSIAGILDYLSGQPERARRTVEMVIAAEAGPLDQARYLLDRIEDGDVPQDAAVPSYSTDWQGRNAIEMVDPESTQQEKYLTIIAQLAADGPSDESVEAYLRHAGAATTSWVDEYLSGGREVTLRISRSTAAQAYVDYLRHVHAGTAPAPGSERALRSAADTGDSAAAVALGDLLDAEHRREQAVCWWRVALAWGNSDAEQRLGGGAVVGAPATGARFCGNCGAERVAGGRFCGGCGAALT